MAKYYGLIGFAKTVETQPGIFREQIVERPYFGEIIKTGRRLSVGKSINDNITITNSLSIIADPYANENLYALHYATYMGARWKISDVDVQYPRLILTLGELYNVAEQES